MILIWVYNRMQPLTNQDLPAMAAVLCNRQTIFRRQTIFPKLDTGSHEALTALTVAPIRRRKWRSGEWFTFSYSKSLQRRWFILTPIGTNKSKLTTWKVDKKKGGNRKTGRWWKRSLAWERRLIPLNGWEHSIKPFKQETQLCQMTNNVLCEAYWKWQDVLMNHFVNFPGSVCCPCTQVPRHGIVKGKKWPRLVLHPEIKVLMSGKCSR